MGPCGPCGPGGHRAHGGVGGNGGHGGVGGHGGLQLLQLHGLGTHLLYISQQGYVTLLLKGRSITYELD